MQYQRMNPLACAIAAGGTELIFVLIFGLPMMSMSGMMGGYGAMMGRGYAHGVGAGVVWWIGGALVVALAGAVFAWIYNAVTRETSPKG
jgi:hypothetical protein